jgi:NAD+ kinase
MRIGLIVHPTRDVDEELDALREWATRNASDVVQVGGRDRSVIEPGKEQDCDLIVTLGGDGTALSGIRLAAEAGKPVLGVACGSLGVLTSVGAEDLSRALDRFGAEEWTAREVPALEAVPDEGEHFTAVNDITVIRDGEGQVTTAASVDGVLYGRFVGDGFVVGTPYGSSAYTFAAGGPLLAPGTSAFALTPLASHGGSVPPLVVGSESQLELTLDVGHGGARLEVDGEASASMPDSLYVRLRPDIATLVDFDDSEPLLSGLRRRQIITDSPRVLARDRRGEEGG